MRALDLEFPIVNLFQLFVTAGGVDAGVGALLNELRVFSWVSWANPTAHFAFVELSNGNCVGLVQASQANGLAPPSRK